jgi:hypothetical protein
MPWLDIEEYTLLGQVPVNAGQIAHQASVVNVQSVPIGAGSTQSNVLNAKTRIVRLHCDVTCRYLFGLNPTAVVPSGGGVTTVTSSRMAAGQTEYFSVPEGGSYIVAVIASA